MSLAVGVVDLHDHSLELAGSITAQVEAGRVEHVAEHAQVGDQRDLPAAGLDALMPQVVEDRRLDVDGDRPAVRDVTVREALALLLETLRGLSNIQ